MGHFFPPPSLRTSFVLRVTAVWLFLRAAAMVGTSLGGEPTFADPSGALGPALLVDPLVVLVLYVEMRRRTELIFLANLGYSFRGLVVGILGICLALEGLLRSILG